MQEFWQFAGSYWWLAFPLAGIVGGWGRSWSKSGERRHERKIELYKLAHPEVAGLDVSATKAAAMVSAYEEPAPQGYSTADVAKLMADHDAVNRRWLDYELDVGKLIDFPMMSDVREPLTVAFLRAKRDADALRPIAATDVAAKSRWDDYRNAVNAFAVSFDVAEREAHRIKDTSFSDVDRQRLGTAKKLVKIAEDEAASPAERQTAYKRARKELDGLIVLPDVSVAALEKKVARMLGGAQ
ncbi:hypothetical protein [Arthrobacter glacialis]|uniref:Uncharacterized protein n=1 Tax=Arthrobacter glacialis TaxID=1664 RepID=A0A2S3ZUX4_ARTGL|nr:hypothetical protein [Arthrobacter glacialis]POH73061.1 hypothetical protein CVS27_12950 [Arthrobacter glacialis]